jgi:hypothetical protein
MARRVLRTHPNASSVGRATARPREAAERRCCLTHPSALPRSPLTGWCRLSGAIPRWAGQDKVPGRRILRVGVLVRVAVLEGVAVLGGLLPVLGGLAAVGLGLEAIQSGILAMSCCCVTTGRGSVAQVNQISAVTGAEVTVAATPVSIDVSRAAVLGGVLDRGHPGRPVTQLRRTVARPGRAVTMIRCDIPGHRPIQDVVDVRVSLRTAPIAFIGNPITPIGRTVPAIGRCIPLVGYPVPFGRRQIPFVRGAFLLGQPMLPLTSLPPPRPMTTGYGLAWRGVTPLYGGIAVACPPLSCPSTHAAPAWPAAFCGTLSAAATAEATTRSS